MQQKRGEMVVKLGEAKEAGRLRRGEPRRE